MLKINTNKLSRPVVCLILVLNKSRYGSKGKKCRELWWLLAVRSRPRTFSRRLPTLIFKEFVAVLGASVAIVSQAS